MREPTARPTGKSGHHDDAPLRGPKAYDAPEASAPVVDFEDELIETESLPVDPAPIRKRRAGLLARIIWTSGGLLVSLALGLAADRLIRDLFARYEWLGWLGLAVVIVLVAGIIALAIKEIAAIRRLENLEALRHRAAGALSSDDPHEGRHIMAHMQSIYQPRADLAQARKALRTDAETLMDGRDMVLSAERRLMTPLDQRARALTAASARRVALVTAVSPRALVDLAFVAWESFRLARAIADLYGARPGLFGSWRLTGAVLSHLAVTGGVALGDSVVQQLVGHGLAARLSARLGEGFVNGLMTVRIGIAAMRVTRPLPFEAQKQPVVMDFMPELAKITRGTVERDKS